jgi:hypothetical protein
MPLRVERLFPRLPQSRDELLGQLEPTVCAIPDREEVAPVHAELDGREHEDADLLSGCTQSRIPINTVVVRDRDHLYSRGSVRFREARSKGFVGLATPGVAVALLGIGGGMDLQIT